MKRRAVSGSILLENHGVVPFVANQSVLDALLKQKFRISHACGGMGSCGTCRVEVVSTHELPARNEVEQERAQELELPEKVRLSCQLKCIDGLAIRISHLRSGV